MPTTRQAHHPSGRVVSARMTEDTITRLEKGEELQPRTLAAIRTALEAAGVVFIDANGNGPGVRLRDR